MTKKKPQDNLFTKEFLNNIQKLVRKIVKEELKNGGWVKTWSATVNTGGTDTVGVYLASDESTEITITNKTGVTLVTSDEVIVASRSGDLSDAFIWQVK